MAVDTLGHLLAMYVTPANEQERAQVEELAKAVQEVTGEHVELAYVDQGYTGEEAERAAAEHGIAPRRWVVERSFGWMSRFRRPARDYERLATTLAGMHFVTFVCLLLHKATPLLTGGS